MDRRCTTRLTTASRLNRHAGDDDDENEYADEDAADGDAEDAVEDTAGDD